jgi:hypothetical protein
MQITDFNNSYLSFSLDLEKRRPTTISHEPPWTLNRVRVLLECRCVIRTQNVETQYVLGAACKGERVNVSEDIWTVPNPDFQLVLSDDSFLIIKSWDRNNKGVMLYPPSLGPQPERQTGKPDEAWSQHGINLADRAARPLETTESIIAAIQENLPLVSHTEFETSLGKVLIEYPVKTINFSERDGYYQIDTGPVIVPDPDLHDENPVANLRLAYIAHNSRDWADLILNVPTELSPEISVNHYSKTMRITGTNRMFGYE